MIILSNEQVKRLHQKLISETGGIDGLRDEGLLDSALASACKGVDAFRGGCCMGRFITYKNESAYKKGRKSGLNDCLGTIYLLA